jgi:cytochrome P450
MEDQLSNRSPRPNSHKALDMAISGRVADPFPLYNEAREDGGGVHWSNALGAWVALRFEDVSAASRDSMTFSSARAFNGPAGWYDRENPDHRRFADINSRILFFTDPPIHTALREIIRQGLTPGAVGHWKPYVEKEVADLLSRFSNGDEVDLVETFAGEIPVAVIARMMGVSVDDRRKFREWSFSLASTFDPLVVGERRNKCISDSLKLMDMFTEIAADRRRTPTDDMTTIIVQSETNRCGVSLSSEDILSILVIMLVAANETTSNFVANGVSLLLDHPDVRKRIQDDPSLLRDAMEEILRVDPPLQLTARTATVDTQLGGMDIKAGERVFLSIAAANRDPRRFSDPETFNIDRKPNPHITFIQGIHSCVGAPLARIEAELTFRGLLKRFPNFSRASSPPVRRTTNIISRGWERLPFRF